MSITERLRRLKARRGFTMVEVLCATIIFAILMVAVFMLFDPINKINRAIKGDSAADTLALTTEEYVAYQLRMATDVEIWRIGTAGQDSYWNNMGDEVVAFYKNNLLLNDVPSALLMKEHTITNPDGTVSHYTFLYRIDRFDLQKLFTGLDLTDPGDVTAAELIVNNLLNLTTLGSDGVTPLLESYRVYNRSFYNGINLDLTARMEGTKVIRMNIRALRDEDNDGDNDDEVRRRESVIKMINIDNPNPFYSSGSRTCKAVEYRVARAAGLPDPVVAADATHTGDYLILYNNIALS